MQVYFLRQAHQQEPQKNPIKNFTIVFGELFRKKTKETLSPEHNFLVLEPKKIKKIEHALQDINISIENSTIGLEKINLKCVLPQTDVYDLYYFFVYVPPDAPKKKLLERYKEIYSNLVKEMTDAANPHPLY